MVLRRRHLLLGSAAAIPALHSAEAQQQRDGSGGGGGRKPRIGYISGTTTTDPNFAAFRKGMQRIGRVEGQNWELLVRFADFNYERFPAFVEELLAEKVDLIVTGGPATVVAPLAAKSVPVVFGYSGDPVAIGVVQSLARPGTNITGMSAMSLELAGKRLSLLVEAAPRIRRVGVLSNPNHGGEQNEWHATERSAKEIGIALNYYPIPAAAQIRGALESAKRDGCDALLTFPEAVSVYNRTLITEFALREALPSVFGWKIYCLAGGLLSYGPDVEAFYGRMSLFVDRILRGTPANDIPVELPVELETVVNIGTAQAIGLKLPEVTLARADEVIG